MDKSVLYLLFTDVDHLRSESRKILVVAFLFTIDQSR